MSRLTPYHDEIVRLHLDEGWNLSEIGDAYGCTREAVRLILKERGAPSLTRERMKERSRYRRLVRAVAVAARHEQRKARHGTRTMYGYGCRCDECREAQNSYMRRLSRDPSMRKSPLRHGTSNAYSNYGCRCTACRAANTARSAEWALTHPGYSKRKKGLDKAGASA